MFERISEIAEKIEEERDLDLASFKEGQISWLLDLNLIAVLLLDFFSISKP